MLKYKDIIDKLNKEQKIALLTDTKEAFGGIDKELFIPETSLNELWEENLTEEREPLFPSAKSIANSWNPELAGDVAKCLATMGASRGDNLFVLPIANATSSVYGGGLAEEPYLTTSIVGGMAKKLKESGVAYCLKEPNCKAQDVRFLDKEPYLPALFDRIARPFRNVIREYGASAVLMENDKAEGVYQEANRKMADGVIPKGVEQLIKIEDGDMTTSALISGKQLIGGSSLVISTALENYNRIYRSMEEGGATVQELNMTLKDGAAISEEMIDEALDRKLELASRCNTNFVRVGGETVRETAYRASQESIVLVKNEEHALPLSKREQLCIVGDIINDGDDIRYKGFKDKLLQAISQSGNSVVGCERGYRLSDSVSPELIDPACEAVTKGATVVAFVGMGATRESRLEINARLTLPGNQIALLTKLRKVAKKLIVVVAQECLPDMSFDNLADAILLAPPQGAYTAQAVWDILSGNANPSGRLACAGYRGIDTSVRELQKRKNKDKQTIGPFVGYRYLDSNGEKTKYPVGFGLSYTSFEFSRIHVDKQGCVSLTVKNAGRLDGGEVVQIYVGKTSSKRIRPRRELKGAIKVFLKAGEKTTVSLKPEDLEIYNPKTEAFALESGEYDVYVSSAFGMDYATKKIILSGVTFTKEDKRLSDYLQNVSNIVSEGYTMEAYCKPMNLKSKLKTFGAILFITTLFADIIYAISCLMLEIDFNDSEFLTIFLIINAVCLAGSLISAIIGSIGIKKRKRLMAKQELKATKELFKNAKPSDVKSIDELFEDEFDISLDAVDKKEVEYSDKDDSTYTFMAVDTDIPTLAHELEAHFKEYGLNIAPKMARRILSAVMTSRLLVVRNAVGVSCERVTEILARFFGTQPHSESLGGQDWSRESLLKDNGNEASPLMQAIGSAANEGDRACFFGLSGVKLKDLGDILMPYVQYFGNPDIAHTVVDGESKIELPSNLWFVVGPDKKESIDDIPAFVSNLATLIDIEAQTVSETQTKTARKYINCHQLDALVFRARKAADIKEELWKGVDSLEAFVNEKTPYHIGNKLFLQMEKYLAIYNACEADLNEAMDCAVAGKLLPAILNLLKGNEGMQDTDLAQVVESFFGEDYVAACRNTIKRLVIGKSDSKSNSKNQNPEAKNEPMAVAEEPKAAVNEPKAVAEEPKEVASETVSEQSATDGAAKEPSEGANEPTDAVGEPSAVADENNTQGDEK